MGKLGPALALMMRAEPLLFILHAVAKQGVICREWYWLNSWLCATSHVCWEQLLPCTHEMWPPIAWLKRSSTHWSPCLWGWYRCVFHLSWKRAISLCTCYDCTVLVDEILKSCRDFHCVFNMPCMICLPPCMQGLQWTAKVTATFSVFHWRALYMLWIMHPPCLVFFSLVWRFYEKQDAFDAGGFPLLLATARADPTQNNSETFLVSTAAPTPQQVSKL